jgi:hypothetical protein
VVVVVVVVVVVGGGRTEAVDRRTNDPAVW